MKNLIWLLKWILKAAIFFTLFAFALNNQHDTTVHFFFGTRWSAPLVLVVLIAFTTGVVVGVVGMIPRWWKQRKAALRTVPPGEADSVQVSELPSSTPVHHGP